MEKVNSFSISRRVIGGALLLFLLLCAGTVYTLYTLAGLTNPEPKRGPSLPHRLPPEDYADNLAKLEYITNFLKTNDIYIKEAFASPIVSRRFSLGDFTQGFTGRELSSELLGQNRNSNIASLKKLNEQLAAELARREKKFLDLTGYLEEEMVLWAHTPNIWPTDVERKNSKFGFRRSPFTGAPTFHEGADLAAQMRSTVRTTADGIVVFAGVRNGYGLLVTVDHGFGYMTRYAHNSQFLVKAGDIVKKGDKIALSGSTGRSAGPHLHYEVLYNGNPLNATKFLP